MKYLLAFLVGFVLVSIVVLHAPASSAGPALTFPDSVTVVDTWHGTRLSVDYHPCDAVATISVSGAYDIQKMPDGSLSVVLGLTASGQHVQVNVDGTHSC